jgi:hypothetical protein
MSARHVASAFALLLSACTCKPEPVITAKVIDWWGHEVPGATVAVQDGQTYTADVHGDVRLPMAGTTNVTVTADGIFPRTTDVVPMSLENDWLEKIEVVPVPPGPGVQIVGPEGYLPVEARPVQHYGDDARPYQGVADLGPLAVTATPLKVVFQAPLKLDDGAQHELALHRLQQLPVPPEVLAATPTEEGAPPPPASVDLWMSAGTVDFEKKPLGDEGAWVFRADDLPAGAYAFATLGLLDAKTGKAFEKIPTVLRTAYTFTVKPAGEDPAAPTEAAAPADAPKPE